MPSRSAAVPDWLIRVAGLLAFLLLWQWLSTRVSRALMPSPQRTWEALRELVADGTLGTAWKESAVQVVLGMAISASLGVGLALVAGWYRVLDRLTAPVSTIVFLTPRIAFVPLIAIWLGYDDLAKIALVVLFSFFEIFFTVKRGVQGFDERWVELAPTASRSATCCARSSSRACCRSSRRGCGWGCWRRWSASCWPASSSRSTGSAG